MNITIQFEGEFEVYRKEGFKRYTFDTLAYWKLSSFTYLKTAARWFLTGSVTSVPSERIFSSAGNIITDSRNKLSPELADKLIFLSNNVIL